MKRAAQKKKKKNSRPQTYKVLDNFATLGNTSSYTATNATLGNTNGTLQTTLGIKPTVAKTYSALIVGTHFLSFEVDAGTCAPLALNTRHIVYEVLNATNAVVYSGTTAGSVSGVAVPISTAGNYTLRYSLFKSSTEPLACQLMLDNIRWDRQVVADEFISTSLTNWTSSTANQLALLNQTLQIKNTQKATRTLALTANKNYNLSLTILKGTTCSASTVTVRIKNGTAIVAQTPITISASSAASIPVSFNFVSPVASPTLEIERTNFNTTSCSALQTDNVYITEKDWVNETFATIGNTSGYASSMPNALALTNTAQQLQLNYIAPSRGMGVSKKVTLDKDQKYTIGYSFKNKMGISANNFVILELIKDGSIMYTRKLQATEATTFDYTAPATGEYTWRMRSSSIGTTTTQPITYSLDNLSIFYSYPYTVENCDNLADGYRFGFNGKEDDRETGTQDYGFRIYNPQLGKFLSVDPLTKSYPWYTPYQFAGNTPIQAIDLDGLEILDFRSSIYSMTFQGKGFLKGTNDTRINKYNISESVRSSAPNIYFKYDVITKPTTIGKDVDPGKGQMLSQSLSESNSMPKYEGAQSSATLSDMESSFEPQATVYSSVYSFVGEIQKFFNNFASISVWEGRSQELKNRDKYYEATNLADDFLNKSTFKNSPEAMLKTIRADLTNYLLDGTLPEKDIQKQGPNNTVISEYSKSKQGYVNSLVKIANTILVSNGYEIQNNTINNNVQNGIKTQGSTNSTPSINGEIKVNGN